MLDFEHLIQVNDFTRPHIKPMSRAQLWQGLLLRARNPDIFNSALQCRTEDVSETEFFRFTTAGESEFEEKVQLQPDCEIHTAIVNDHPFRAESHTTIEEPEEGSLFVRFRYKRDLDENETVNVGEHLKSAYLQIDREAVAMIRMLVEQESSNTAVN